MYIPLSGPVHQEIGANEGRDNVKSLSDSHQSCHPLLSSATYPSRGTYGLPESSESVEDHAIDIASHGLLTVGGERVGRDTLVREGT